jgi:hypothetical protein
MPNFQFEIASARMYSPTKFVVSGEIGSMSTRGSIDAVQQSPFSGSIRLVDSDDDERELLPFPLPSEFGASLRHPRGTLRK